MESNNSPRGWIAIILGSMAALNLMPCLSGAAEVGEPASNEPVPATASDAAARSTDRRVRKPIIRLPLFASTEVASKPNVHFLTFIWERIPAPA